MPYVVRMKREANGTIYHFFGEHPYVVDTFALPERSDDPFAIRRSFFTTVYKFGENRDDPRHFANSYTHFFFSDEKHPESHDAKYGLLTTSEVFDAMRIPRWNRKRAEQLAAEARLLGYGEPEVIRVPTMLTAVANEMFAGLRQKLQHLTPAQNRSGPA